MKHCNRCQTTKTLAEFPRNRRNKDGLQDYCKPCMRDYSVAYRKRKGLDAIRAISRASHQRHADKRAEDQKRMRKMYPEKQRARSLLHQAVSAGQLKRQPCAVCGDVKSQGHHEDYSRPLDVVWFCNLHHAQRHKELRESLIVLIIE